jgi:hypothetical protein
LIASMLFGLELAEIATLNHLDDSNNWIWEYYEKL